MIPFRRFHQFNEDVFNGKHDLSADTIKAMLVTAVPDFETDSVKADLTELGAGNGYTAGGVTLTGVSSVQTAGTYCFKSNDISWTASGGDIGTFRAVVIYNDTSAGDLLIGAYVFATIQGIPNGDPWVLNVNQTNGYFFAG
jgi:hypothetical protein